MYGLLNLPFWGYIVALFVLTHLTIIGVTVYLHRCQAHRSLELHPILSHFFRCWLWLTTGMNTREWVAIHRKHHAKCETPDDPHSPQTRGLKKVLWEGAELYREEAKNKDTIGRYSHGTPDDWVERKVYDKHPLLGISMMFVLDIVFFGVPGITMWALQMMWIPFFAAGIVNGVGHYWGYRNFECPDAARNLSPLGFIIGGEELHNNHHTFPTSAKLSVKPWEFDLGWFYISTFKLLGLARVKRLPPVLKHKPEKTHIDLETLTAIISNRFQVLARYTKEVIRPAVRIERERAGHRIIGNLPKSTSDLLGRSEILLDAKSKQSLENIIKDSHKLALVYQFRLKLQDIWLRTTGTQKELLEALQDWCKQAEATGIQTLCQFAINMASFSSAKVLKE